MTPPPSPRFPDVSTADVLAEIEREAASRLRAHPAMVDKMRMTAEAATREQRLCEAWAADVRRWRDWTAGAPARWQAYMAGQQVPRCPAQVHTLGFTWHDRRDGIARELERRARYYPRWIAAGQLDSAEAARRNDRLAVLAEIYDDGWDWHDTFGLHPTLGRTMGSEPTTPAEAECRAQWHAHVLHVLTARAGGHQQEQLAL